MKTLSKYIRLVNFVTFVTLVSISTLIGKMAGEVNFGIALGIAAGIIGINAAYYFREQYLEKEKNTEVIPVRAEDQDFRNAA
jgi:hypothetical protein